MSYPHLFVLPPSVSHTFIFHSQRRPQQGTLPEGRGVRRLVCSCKTDISDDGSTVAASRICQGMMETVSKPLVAAAAATLLLGRKNKPRSREEDLRIRRMDRDGECGNAAIAEKMRKIWDGEEEKVAEDDIERIEEDHGLKGLRPLVAFTVGVTLFLLTRAPGIGCGKVTEMKISRKKKKGIRDRKMSVMGRFVKRNGGVAVDGDVWRDGWRELEDGLREGWREFEDGLLLWRGSERDWKRVSELGEDPRDVVIVTTAALPWFTGTSVNPLLRAMYLARDGHHVTLVLPWMGSPEDQKRVFPSGVLFKSQEQQAMVVRDWIIDQGGAGDGPQLDIRFYEGVYSEEWGSIFPMGDITGMFRDDEWKRDVCVLEEPEHLTWHHTGERWTKLFDYVVGVVHTNYLEYAKSYGWFGRQRALFLEYLNKWVCRSYCHRVIKLSDAVQELPLSVTCNVHGVRDKFINLGRARRGIKFKKGAYFLGKVLWAKGYERLIELMERHYRRSGERLLIDLFGTGPDLVELKQRVHSSYGLSKVNISGIYIDHAADALHEYKLFVNPSESDVVCTATAEALAMGKFVVCLEHPSNEFFASFRNCLVYRTPVEFSEMVTYALAHDPVPLSEDEAYRLTWDAATRRFYNAARITDVDVSQARVDQALAVTHKTICSTLVTAPSNNAMREKLRKERNMESLTRR